MDLSEKATLASRLQEKEEEEEKAGGNETTQEVDGCMEGKVFPWEEDIALHPDQRTVTGGKTKEQYGCIYISLWAALLMRVCLCVCLSMCIVCLCAVVLVCVYLYACLYVSDYASVCLSAYLPACLIIYLYVCLSFCLCQSIF